MEREAVSSVTAAGVSLPVALAAESGRPEKEAVTFTGVEARAQASAAGLLQPGTVQSRRSLM